MDTQVAFDNQMHELKLLMAADEKLWQLRGSVVSIAAEAAAMQGPQGDANSPISLQEPEWTTQQVTQCLPRHMHRLCDSGSTLTSVGAFTWCTISVTSHVLTGTQVFYVSLSA